MGALNNLRKAYIYMKKNGLKATIYASAERLGAGRDEYKYVPLSDEKAAAQSRESFEHRTRFSVVVPMYETDETYGRAMIDSVLSQTYTSFELMLVDASKSDLVENFVRSYEDQRINYIRLTQNLGISENTNAGIKLASGSYILFLDHDDMLTRDALYELARCIERGIKDKSRYSFVYADEDKCDSAGSCFYEPNIKPEFNLDLLLTNNYICHPVAMEAGLAKRLLLRSEFDGAQDHDLLLRACSDSDLPIGKVDKVLYHWRCHEASTAANPESKLYAYEAGRRAVSDYLSAHHIDAAVIHSKHNGFFRICYGALEGTSGELNAMEEINEADEIFRCRYDIGVIGGPLVKNGKITGGMLNETKTCPFEGMPLEFSGYMHRASLQQDACGVDLRNMYLRKELYFLLDKLEENPKFRNILNGELIKRQEKAICLGDYADLANVDEETLEDYSMELCRLAGLEGYLVYYDPALIKRKTKS